MLISFFLIFPLLSFGLRLRGDYCQISAEKDRYISFSLAWIGILMSIALFLYPISSIYSVWNFANPPSTSFYGKISPDLTKYNKKESFESSKQKDCLAITIVPYARSSSSSGVVVRYLYVVAWSPRSASKPGLLLAIIFAILAHFRALKAKESSYCFNKRGVYIEKSTQ